MQMWTYSEHWKRMGQAYCAAAMFGHLWPSFTMMFNCNIQADYIYLIKTYNDFKFHVASSILDFGNADW
jgi:hypothetical protein